MFAKGNTLGKGRKKGTRNKLTMCAKANIEETFERIGGIEAFANWATLNPGDFYKLIYTKVVPRNLEMSGVDGGEITISWVKPQIDLREDVIDETPKEISGISS